MNQQLMGNSPTSGLGLVPTLSVNLARLFEHGLSLQVQIVLPFFPESLIFLQYSITLLHNY